MRPVDTAEAPISVIDRRDAARHSGPSALPTRTACAGPASTSPMMIPRLFLVASTTLFLAACVCLGVGEVLSRPAAQAVGQPPAHFRAQTVRLDTEPGQFVVGWFLRGEPSKGAVLLLHGVRGNRTQMLGRAVFLARAGYSTLLIDLPAHGESSGDRITFGARESRGVRAAVAFLRDALPQERLGVIGVSLGAASTVLADLSPAPDAIVIESMYPTIEEAVADRLTAHLGDLGGLLAPLLLWQLPLRTGIEPADLRPIRRVPRLGAPLLVASGSRDRHTTWAETQRIYDEARSPKELWKVEGAAHEDLHGFQPGRYETRILEFLGRYLRAG